MLGRIERRADVLLRPLEHDKAFGDGRQFMELRIGTREMNTQRATLRTAGVDQERDVVGLATRPVPQ